MQIREKRISQRANGTIVKTGIRLVLVLAALCSVSPTMAADDDTKIVEQARAAIADNDYSKAKALVAPLAERNVAAAQNVLGDLKFASGENEEAFALYTKAALLGDAKAQNNLGMAHASGRGTARNDLEAVKWWRQAAEQGHAKAQNNLSVMYSRGRGVPEDAQLAAQWCEKAAEQGDVSAQENMGGKYRRGHGVVQDGKQAMKWFQKAAEQKSSIGIYGIGELYESGTGVTVDKDEALKWYQKAAALGSHPAQDKLLSLLDVNKQNEAGVLVLAPGDKFSIKFDVIDQKLVHLERSTTTGENAANFKAEQLDFSASFEPELKMTLLNVKNNLKKSVIYDCLISRPGEPFIKTSIIPIRAGLFCVESWPGRIDKLLIRNIRLLPE